MNIDEVKVRCSSLGDLVNDKPNITEIQATTIAKLTARKEATDDLTDKMKLDLSELIAKRDAPYQLTSGGKTVMINSYIDQAYRREEGGESKETKKGEDTEYDTIKFMSDRDFPIVYEKNDERINTNPYLTGIPDVRKTVSGKRIIKEGKSSYSIHTHIRNRIEGPNKKYIWQGKGYCFIDDASECEIIHYLTNNTLDAVRNILFYKSIPYNGNMPHALKLDVIKNHVFDKKTYEKYAIELDCMPDDMLSQLEFDSFVEVPDSERAFTYFTSCTKEDKELIIESVTKGREFLKTIFK